MKWKNEYFFTDERVLALYDPLATVVEDGYEALHSSLQFLALHALNKEVHFIVDLGVGTGPDIAPICEKEPGLTYIGIDISKGSLDLASRKVEELTFSSDFRPVAANICELDLNALEAAMEQAGFLRGHCIVISAMTLHHMTAEEKAKIYSLCSDLCGQAGSFINADLFRFGSATLDSEAVVESLARMNERFDLLCANPQTENIEQVRDLQQKWAEHYAQHETLASIQEEFEILQSADFSFADCCHRNGQRATLLATRQEQ